eukprot:TRINITY_DN9033_c0_g1_i1.p1 TRINITY_DN9033_c0_g1~~TRINITY_DN9033_c0_g1_i1.p1  ORF type:complete len:562 (+),score=113.83 TRINITY_DN9033_c0_g1_i1:49-1734(+)
MPAHRRDARPKDGCPKTIEEAMRERVCRWLAERDFVVIDGGTGTEIEKEAGLAAMNVDGWSCWCNVTHPEVVVKVHRKYLEAGADIIIANTYATNPNVMLGAGFTPEQQRLSTITGVELAKQAVREYKAAGGRRDPLIAGSLSCHPPKMPHNAEFDKGTWPLPPEEELNCTRHAELLKEAGVDVIFLEMVWDFDHGMRALRAAVSVGLPVFAAACIPLPMTGPLTEMALRRLTIPDDDITLGGSGCTTVVESVREMIRYPNVVGVNIHHTPLPFVRAALEAVRKAGWTGFIGVYPDHGTFRNPHWEALDLDKSTFLIHCEQWVETTGCKGIGGCCGIGPDVIESINGHRERLKEKWRKWDRLVNKREGEAMGKVEEKGVPGGSKRWLLIMVMVIFVVAWYDLMHKGRDESFRDGYAQSLRQEWVKDCGEEWRGVWYFIIDTDNNGVVTTDEFTSFLTRRPKIRRRLLRNTRLTIERLLHKLDPSGSGVITLSNFSKIWRSRNIGNLEDPCPLPKKPARKPQQPLPQPSASPKPKKVYPHGHASPPPSRRAADGKKPEHSTH